MASDLTPTRKLSFCSPMAQQLTPPGLHSLRTLFPYLVS